MRPLEIQIDKDGNIKIWDDSTREIVEKILDDSIEKIEELPRLIFGERIYCG